MANLSINYLQTQQADFDACLKRLRDYQPGSSQGLAKKVQKIIATVRAQGDAALLDYARQFENIKAEKVTDRLLQPADLQAALMRLGTEQRQALEFAAKRIRAYHQHQQETSWQYQDELGNELGQRISPLKRVGFYIPGGQASYPSSVLMTMIPAHIAGVDELIMVSPNSQDNDMVLAAAALAGAGCCYTFGGAHAVAALAWGTESVPRVDKIVGPGGLYVTEAKRQLYGQVGIDMLAGPSEIMIISDGSAPPEMLALDLLAQAEHDSAAQSLIVSPDQGHLKAVGQAVMMIARQLPRLDIIAASLSHRGAFIGCRDLTEAVELANRIAPEHLELAVQEPDELLPAIRHAGAIFVGTKTPEVLGDYTAGPSHVLPTQGAARFSSPLGVYDFIKRSSILKMSAAGSRALAAPAAKLARAEGLEAHARSAEMRQQIMTDE